MIRGTTPTHTFQFDKIEPEDLSVIKIYYAQQGKELFVKTKDDCVFSTKETEDGIVYLAAVTLTQEETLMFRPKYEVSIQLRVLTADNRSLASKEYKVPVFDVINDEVLEDEA